KAIEERVTAWLAASAIEIKAIGQPARVALTGRPASPGLFEVLEVLGREDSLARIEKAKRAAEEGPAPGSCRSPGPRRSGSVAPRRRLSTHPVAGAPQAVLSDPRAPRHPPARLALLPPDLARAR